MHRASTGTRGGPSQRALDAAKALHAEGYLDAAHEQYQHLIEAHPKAPEPKALLGALLVDRGDTHRALPLLVDASQRLRQNADVQYNLGLAQAELGDLPAAIESYRRALKLRPDHPKAQYNLGVAYRRTGEHRKASVVLGREFRRSPAADTARLLCRSLESLGQHDEALQYARRCVELPGATPDDLNALVTALCRECSSLSSISDEQQGTLLALSEHAVTLTPDSTTALVNAGRARAQLGLHQAAIEPYEKAVQLDPENETAHQLFAISLLTEGQLDRGWHERTLLTRMRESVSPGVPRWQGDASSGLRLAIINEQGIGDQVLYLGMLNDLIEAGVEISLTCEARLKPLLARSFPNVSLAETVDAALEHADAFITLGELHLSLRPSLSSIPEPKPYLRADSTLSKDLRGRWQTAYPGQRFTGIAWQSYSGDLAASKSVELDALLPVLKLPGHVFVCAQYGDGWHELQAHARKHDYAVHLDPECNSLTDVDAGAAQLDALDALVSVSNASVHTAAALGKDVHVLVGARPVWHWFSSGESSPWYPSVRLYRQTNLMDWDAPIESLATQLANPE